MQKARMIGNYVEHLAQAQNLSVHDISSVLGCSDAQINEFFKGRFFLNYAQLNHLAEKLQVNVHDILAGYPEQYSATVVHCMNEFDDANNREQILDLIDDYLDILDRVG